LVAKSRLPQASDVAFMQAKITTARFYADHIVDQGTAACATALSKVPTASLRWPWTRSD